MDHQDGVRATMSGIREGFYLRLLYALPGVAGSTHVLNATRFYDKNDTYFQGHGMKAELLCGLCASL